MDTGGIGRVWRGDWSGTLDSRRDWGSKFTFHITTAQRAIRLLQEKQIISQIDESQRDKVLCATAIMEILNETPKINL